jgi:hypothetical protein
VGGLLTQGEDGKFVDHVIHLYHIRGMSSKVSPRVFHMTDRHALYVEHDVSRARHGGNLVL